MSTKENERLLTGCDLRMTMNLEDNLGDHTPSTHSPNISIEENHLLEKEYSSIDSNDTINFNNENGFELGSAPDSHIS
jgi:hypothetical protein